MRLVKCVDKKSFKLTVGKTYEVEAELFDLEDFETYAVEMYDDMDRYIALPMECIEVVK